MVGRCSPKVLRGLVSVGPLLAVLMSLQQGAAGVRCLIARRKTGFFARYCQSPNILGGFGGRTGPAGRVRAAAECRADEDHCRPAPIAPSDAAAGDRNGLPCRFVNAVMQ